ncbi:MAG: type II secretion system F family protein [Actinomycetota bacterium]|nr:type II secretion system F family protein [Actinomycetota bacterium]
MMSAVLCLLLIVPALLVWPDGPGRERAPARPKPTWPPGWLRTVAPAAGIPLAAVLLVPAWWWGTVFIAVPLGWFLLRRADRPSAAVLVGRRRELAGRLDLIAACLRSGLPVASALTAVAHACNPIPRAGAGPRRVPPKGRQPGCSHPVDVLEEVAALLAVGADPTAAWRGASVHPDLASIAAAACRSAIGGTTLAAAFSEQSRLLRRQNSDAASAAAGRAGVLMTAPLGACFLPAFLCLGLAPAIVGLLGTLQLW